MEQITTKIQEVGKTKTTSIPKTFVHLLDLQKGDILQWNIDIKTGIMSVKRKKRVNKVYNKK